MFQKLIRKITRSLSRHKIPYMIIGGQAVLYYGEPRLTKDIDITLGITISEIERILKVIKGMGLSIRTMNPAAFARKTMVIPSYEKESGIGIDFILSYTPYEEQAIKRAKKVYLGKTSVCIATLEDVVVHKFFAGRPRDIEDIKSILLKNPRYDKKYIITWLKKFDISLGSKYTGSFRSLIKELKKT
jgi:predicted nucleotidyltransferase